MVFDQKRIEQGLWNAVRITLTALVCLVLFLLLIDSFFPISYVWKVTFPFESLALLLISAGVLFALVFFLKDKALPFQKVVFIVAGVSFLVQIVLMYFLYAFARGDAGTVSEFARRIVFGENADEIADYFSVCSNNLFLASLEICVLFVCKLLSIGNWRFVLIVLGCLSTSISGIFVAFLSKKYTKNDLVSLLFYGIFVVFIVFSPRNTVPYSDVYGMLFPTLALYLWLERDKQKWALPPIAGFLIAFGSGIKPTVAILLIAILGVELVRVLTEDKKKDRLISLALLLLGAGVGLVVTTVGVALLPYSFDPDRELGIWHYLMLGQNASSNGTYTDTDLAFTTSFLTAAEKAAANRAEALARISEMGFFGYFAHLFKKLLVTFGDGAFAWAYECEFVVGIPEANALGSLLRSLFRAEGGAYPVYAVLSEFVWIFLLLSMVGNLFTKDFDPIVALALIGVFFYQLLFEAGARYLFLFVPLFFLFAVTGFLGWKNLLAKKTQPSN